MPESVEITATDPGPKRLVWIQVAKPGVFRGHPAGPFELTTKVFEEIIDNFNSSDNRRIPIDFEHASEADPTQGNIPQVGAPAQGWIVGFKIESGNLYGLVEWGDLARQYIESGQYRYFSPAIRFHSKDRVTGKPVGARMTSGAMTNVPYLDAMAPLVAKDRAVVLGGGSWAYSSGEYMPQIRTALRLPELCTARECAEALDALSELHAAGGGRDMHGVPVGAYVGALRDAMRVPMSTTVEDLLDSVGAMIRAAVEEGVGDEDDEDEGDLGDVNVADLDDETGLGATEMATAEQHEDASMSDQARLKELEADKVRLETDKAKLEADKVRLETDKAKVDAEKVALGAEKQGLVTEAATLSLQLRDAQARADTLETEVKTLREEKEARDARDIQKRVDDAFDHYRDSKRLSEGDKAAMLVVCSQSRAAFETLYPPVRADQAHFLKELTTQREPSATGATTVQQGGARSEAESISALTRRLMAERHLSFPDAQCEAAKIVRGRAA